MRGHSNVWAKLAELNRETDNSTTTIEALIPHSQKWTEQDRRLVHTGPKQHNKPIRSTLPA
jgi:hypothetical protein